MLTNPWPEVMLTSAACLILILYHSHLLYRLRKAPLTTSFGLTNRLRRDWVQAIMEGGKDILAVQTLRNWVMASSFLASAAILIGLGILNAAFRTEKLAECSQTLNLFGTKSGVMWLVKLMVLVIDFFFAFFNFTLSIRHYNHARFTVNVFPSDDPIITYDAVAKIINRTTTHYTLGMRGYYFAVPFTFWLFGPFWMLLGSLMIVAILYRVDRTI